MASVSDSGSKHVTKEMRDEAESIRTVRFEELWKNHPRDEGAHSLGKRIGGQIAEVMSTLTPPAKNDSAVRLSLAFNAAGHFMKSSDTHSGLAVTDAAGHVYVLSPTEMHAILSGRHGLGEPHKVSGKDIVRVLGKRSGIIYFDKVPSLGGGSYIDLWHGAADRSDTATSLGHTFLSEAGATHFWALDDTHVAE